MRLCHAAFRFHTEPSLLPSPGTTGQDGRYVEMHLIGELALAAGGIVLLMTIVALFALHKRPSASKRGDLK